MSANVGSITRRRTTKTNVDFFLFVSVFCRLSFSLSYSHRQNSTSTDGLKESFMSASVGTITSKRTKSNMAFSLSLCVSVSLSLSLSVSLSLSLCLCVCVCLSLSVSLYLSLSLPPSLPPSLSLSLSLPPSLPPSLSLSVISLDKIPTTRDGFKESLMSSQCGCKNKEDDKNNVAFLLFFSFFFLFYVHRQNSTQDLRPVDPHFPVSLHRSDQLPFIFLFRPNYVCDYCTVLAKQGLPQKPSAKR